MADKKELQNIKDYFQQLIPANIIITETLLNKELGSKKLSEEELFEVREFLETLPLSDGEMETLINWFETKELETEVEDNELLEDDALLDDDLDALEDSDELDDDYDGSKIDENEEDYLNELKANYADNPSVKASDPVKMYLKDIGRVPLLKPDEEKKIAYSIHGNPDLLLEIEDLNNRIMQDQMQIDELEKIGKGNRTKAESNLLGKYKRDISTCSKKVEKLTAENEEYCQREDFPEMAQQARHALTTANLRLVVAIAKKFVGRGLLFLDLIQEGNMGLVKAVEKFEPSKGFKFSTYATWWIRQAITRAIADQARTIRIPVHMVETINKLTRVQRQLVQELGREPSAEEISAKMNGQYSPEKVREIQKIALDPVSLETPIGEEDDSHLGDFIEDKEAVSPDEYATRQLLKDEINSVLQLLTERERKVLQLRFGLIDGRTRTLEEVGKEFNVTRERIRQIEAKALRKLKHPTKSKRLKDFVDRV